MTIGRAGIPRKSITQDAPDNKNNGILKITLFGISFTALFLELMLIRWVPSIIQVVSYYANLMLISSFLGLGLGAMMSSKGYRLFRWFPALICLDVGAIYFCRYMLLPGSTVEMRFFAGSPTFLNYLILVGLFVANTAVFVPLGEKIGDLFGALPRLEAYAWDLGGSIAGTIVFGFFSLYAFSPLIGIIGAMALYLYFSKGKSLLISIPFFAVTMFLLYASIELESRAIWSPYHYITLRDESLQGAPFAQDPPESLSAMENPPIYRAQVNQNYYQLFGSIDIQRYTQNYSLYPLVKILRDQYFMPYDLFKSPPENVVVFGSGGGMDVEAALLAGARKVDAVDIILHAFLDQ